MTIPNKQPQLDFSIGGIEIQTKDIPNNHIQLNLDGDFTVVQNINAIGQTLRDNDVENECKDILIDPKKLKLDEGFKVPETNAFGKTFRDHIAESEDKDIANDPKEFKLDEGFILPETNVIDQTFRDHNVEDDRKDILTDLNQLNFDRGFMVPKTNAFCKTFSDHNSESEHKEIPSDHKLLKLDEGFAIPETNVVAQTISDDNAESERKDVPSNPKNLKLDEGFMVPKNNAFGQRFRDHNAESERKDIPNDHEQLNLGEGVVVLKTNALSQIFRDHNTESERKDIPNDPKQLRLDEGVTVPEINLFGQRLRDHETESARQDIHNVPKEFKPDEGFIVSDPNAIDHTLSEHIGKTERKDTPNDPKELKLDEGFTVPEINAFGQTFRDYNAESERKDGVEEFYRTNHINQSYEFVKRMREEYGKLNRAEMSIWECCELLNEYVDESDPDLDEPQIEHLLQTAEAIRKDYPDEDWLHLTGLIHDLGKVLLHPKFGELPQWAVVGDTFPVGCAFDESCVHHKYFKDNADYNNSKYNTKNGVYSEGCGLDNIMMSWGHDDYMYIVAKENKTTLPSAALFIIRYHSFYPLHRSGAYTHLMDENDVENLKWLRIFNKYDLYSKSKVRIDVEKVKPYYLSLIEKYFPPKLNW